MNKARRTKLVVAGPLLAVLTLCLVNAAGAQAPNASTVGDANDGAAYFEQTCRSCHASPEGLGTPLSNEPPSETKARLSGFLTSHFATNETGRTDVIAYLQTFAAVDTLVAGDASNGELEYARHCVACHVSSARVVRRVPGDTADARGNWLWSFLAVHNAEEDVVRADIIGFLISD